MLPDLAHPIPADDVAQRFLASRSRADGKLANQFVSELTRRQALIGKPDWTRYWEVTFEYERFLKKADPRLWQEAAKMVIDGFGSDVEIVAVLAPSRGGQVTYYNAFVKEISRRLQGLNNVWAEQLMDKHIRREIPYVPEATGKKAVIVEILELADGFVETARRFLVQEGAEVAGVAVLFGVGSAGAEPDDSLRIFCLDLGATRKEGIP